jgi:RimJ/RimL family protein N-acetyltransferase
MIRQLNQGERVILTAPDPEKDAEILAGWTNDPAYLRSLSAQPAYPQAPFLIKKQIEEAEKATEASGAQSWFAIRLRQDERLIGFLRFDWLLWSNGTANLQIGIGQAADRSQGYGGEALEIALRYAFHELNLFHLRAVVAGHNTGGLRFFTRARFSEEARQRQRIRRDGQCWDLIWLGLHRQTWEERAARQSGQEAQA